MGERQYNEEEVAAIFGRAAETEHSLLPVAAEGKGMTLAALQDIGREVGILPDSVSRAARSLDLIGYQTSAKLMGLPIYYGAGTPHGSDDHDHGRGGELADGVEGANEAMRTYLSSLL